MKILSKKKTKFEMRLRCRIRAAILVLVTISVFNACRSNIPTANNPKYKEVESLWKTIPVYAGWREVKTGTTSTTAETEIIKKYESNAGLADVEQFYRNQLPSSGWEQVDDRSIKDRGRIRGEQILVFQKENFWLTIEFAGTRSAELGWDFAVRLATPKDWDDRVP